MTRLEAMVSDKRAQWDAEARHCAALAIQRGCSPMAITYPTGLQMMRFAEPFAEFGMHYEVPLAVWQEVIADHEAIRQGRPCRICGMIANVDPFFHGERYGHAPKWDE